MVHRSAQIMSDLPQRLYRFISMWGQGSCCAWTSASILYPRGTLTAWALEIYFGHALVQIDVSGR